MGKACADRNFFNHPFNKGKYFFMEMHHQKGRKGEPEGDG